MSSRLLAVQLTTLAALALPAPGTAAESWRCEARGGPAWRDVRTEHFRLLTDAPPAEARALARDLEALQLAVRSALFRTPPPMPGQLPVVAFSDAVEFRTFAPGGAAAFEATLDGRAALVVSRSSGEATRVAVAHALARQVLARVFLRQPPWFAAGLAAYLETLGVGSFAVGRVPRNRLEAVTPWPGGLGEVLRARTPLASPREQALAWALVFHLAQARPREFAVLQGRLARGAEPDVAWREAFPAWSPADPAAMAALDAEVGAHLARGGLAARPLAVPSGAPELEERRLPAGEVHALRLSLARAGLPEEARRATFRGELEEALAEDPAHVVALRALAAERPAEARALSGKAVTAHPDDPRAWLLAAAYAAEPATREAAYRRALELAPEHEAALNDLAWFLASSGRAADALPLARRATALAPASPAVLDTYAAVLAELGRCADALPVQRRAVELLTAAAGADTRAAYVARLEKLQASCGAPGP